MTIIWLAAIALLGLALIDTARGLPSPALCWRKVHTLWRRQVYLWERRLDELRDWSGPTL
jgi:hypothetical protein